MKFVFRILLASGSEVRHGFLADTEEGAHSKATEWAGEGAIVGECVERWEAS